MCDLWLAHMKGSKACRFHIEHGFQSLYRYWLTYMCKPMHSFAKLSWGEASSCMCRGLSDNTYRGHHACPDHEAGNLWQGLTCSSSAGIGTDEELQCTRCTISVISPYLKDVLLTFYSNISCCLSQQARSQNLLDFETLIHSSSIPYSCRFDLSCPFAGTV